MTSSTRLQKGTYIGILVSIKRQFLVVFIDWEHDLIKATFIPAVVSHVWDAASLTRHFQGGHLLHKAVRHPSLRNLAIFFLRINKVHVL